MESVCAQCNERFASDRYCRRFCGRECYYESRRKPKAPKAPIEGKRERKGGRPRNRVVVNCRVCGHEFESVPSRNARYCSKACWSVRNPPLMHNCLFCGKEFWARSYDKRKHCSKRCDSLHRRELQAGANSHFWKGGKTKLNQILRSRAKYDEWRTAVFVRDKYACQECGARCGNGVRIYLHAHHIKSWADYPELRYEVSNGVTLCVNCHQGEHPHVFTKRIELTPALPGLWGEEP